MSDNLSDVLKKDQLVPWILLIVLTGLLVLSYGNTLLGTAQKWESPQYSHGYLVPAFAAILLWLRHQPFEQVAASARWAGVGLLGIGLILRLATAYIALIIPEMLTFLPSLAGIFLLVGGWSTLRWAWPAIAFLIFMFPLPDVVERGLLDPLQGVATTCSTFALQTLGLAVYSEGNRIIIGRLQLGVVDACSGLRMLTIFLALATAITLVTDRPMWQRIVIIFSAIPIALLVNVTRITVTGILHVTVGPEIADKVFHDFAGWVMMPLALGLLYAELQLLSHLVVEDEPMLGQPSGLSVGVP